jgi:hypothetical protein
MGNLLDACRSAPPDAERRRDDAIAALRAAAREIEALHGAAVALDAVLAIAETMIAAR